MMPGTRPVSAADARAAVLEAKLARVISRLIGVIDVLETMEQAGPLSVGDQSTLADLREILAEAKA